uniref:Waprin-Phi2 n=1 Tax=Philodryas olfersii TaxID=120305 RepID=WAP2_PHIOL|nr:RecName: Full=Waprin-Phi2; Flags: Precursor [Philodryas olfersii]ABU68543.1 Waprin-Phi2 [Philodryas olfersii]
MKATLLLLLLFAVILPGTISAEQEKPGSCPNVDMPIPPLGLCKTTCSKDSDCSETKKCCKNGCGFMTCTTARP